MLHCPQGLHAFLRAYYHHKSADWKQNTPFPLKALTADEWASYPLYVMDLDKGMAETVAPEMPSAAEIAACKWLTDEELKVFSVRNTAGRVSRAVCRRISGAPPESKYTRRATVFSGRTIDVPSLFVAGKSDWGVYQTPGAVETMRNSACTRMVGFHLVDGAGHWVQQEQPEESAGCSCSF